MQVCAAVDPGLKVEWTQKDGDFVVKGAIFGEVRGSARSILVAERVALNFLQRMSGIATATHAMAEATKVPTPRTSSSGKIFRKSSSRVQSLLSPWDCACRVHCTSSCNAV